MYCGKNRSETVALGGKINGTRASGRQRTTFLTGQESLVVRNVQVMALWGVMCRGRPKHQLIADISF